MSTKTIIISSSGLKNITLNSSDIEDDLILAFGDHTIQMNRIFAEFISPIVSHIRQSDPTIQYVNFENLFSSKKSDFIKCTNDIFSSDIISIFRDISSGSSIEIDNSQALKLRLLSIILGNEELFIKIKELFPPDFSKENISNYIDFIQTCYHFSRFSTKFDFTGLIDNISRNFYSIEPEKILKLPRSIQYSIISNPHLQILSEDSLLDIINQINENDQNSIEKVGTDEEKIDDILFYEHIEFTGLSEEKLREFLSNFDFNLMTNFLWQKFYDCFFIRFDEKPERIFKPHSDKHTFEYIDNKTDRFEGIIHYLTEKFGGNVDEKGVVKITASSVYDDFMPRNAVEYSDDYKSFSTTVEVDKKNAWLKFDFLNRKVRPTNYSIQTIDLPSGNSHLKSWVIEGSNSDKNWKILDSRNNETCLDDNLAENTFDIHENLDADEYYRYLRIRQTGLNSRKTSQLIINAH